jgi:N-acetylglucosamine kinase-like BadF-type ATPase
MPRTLLYEAFLDKFHVIDPLHFPMALKEYFPNDVAGIAAFQRDVLALYQQGDPCVREIYEQAAKELARLVSALMSRLSFDKSKRVDVSYSGGFFKSGECILLPFRREIEEAGGSLVNPAYGPLAGAISYSARGFLNVETLEKMLRATDAAMQQD